MQEIISPLTQLAVIRHETDLFIFAARGRPSKRKRLPKNVLRMWSDASRQNTVRELLLNGKKVGKKGQTHMVSSASAQTSLIREASLFHPLLFSQRLKNLCGVLLFAFQWNMICFSQ